MSRNRRFLSGCLVSLLVVACRRDRPEGQAAVVTGASSLSAGSSSPDQMPLRGSSDLAAKSPAALVPPTRLLTLPASAYAASLALQGDHVLLFTPTAAFRLAPGETPRKADLDLGLGPVLTESGIVYWSKGAIWNASIMGGAPSRLASAPKQPAYFVASSAGLAWLEHSDDGLFSIQSLRGKRAHPLLTEHDEISAVAMIRDWVFFVRRAENKSWRIGRVNWAGGEAEYTDVRTGPTPASLTGTESIAYYDLGKSEIRQLLPDLKSEQVWLKNFVCSPIHEATDIYCACVEGVFVVARENHKPKVLAAGREPITFLQADSKQIAWIADAGRNQLAVDWLPAR